MAKGTRVDLDMIVYMLDRNENLCIHSFLTICLCLVVGDDLVIKFARLLEDQIWFTSIFDHNSS